MFPFGKQDFRYLIGQIIKKAKILWILFPETNEYRLDLDETECMSFLIKDKELLEKYNEISEN